METVYILAIKYMHMYIYIYPCLHRHAPISYFLHLALHMEQLVAMYSDGYEQNLKKRQLSLFSGVEGN